MLSFLIIVILILVEVIPANNDCKTLLLPDVNGTITLNNDHCTRIKFTKLGIITLKILKMTNVFRLKYNSVVYDVTYRTLLSIRGTSTVVLIFPFGMQKLQVVLNYFIRDGEICPESHFVCHDGRNCFNSSDICDDNFQCPDHSDEFNCRQCNTETVPCSDLTSCFNPDTERCSGFPECFDKSDEWNCDFDSCNSSINFLCSNGFCIRKSLVNNGQNDCGDFSDERVGMSSITTLIFIGIFCLTITFIIIIMKWLSSRVRMNRIVMQNPVEFPLPPFYGPGEITRRTPTEIDFRRIEEVYSVLREPRPRLPPEVRSEAQISRTLRNFSIFEDLGEPSISRENEKGGVFFCVNSTKIHIEQDVNECYKKIYVKRQFISRIPILIDRYNVPSPSNRRRLAIESKYSKIPIARRRIMENVQQLSTSSGNETVTIKSIEEHLMERKAKSEFVMCNKSKKRKKGKKTMSDILKIRTNENCSTSSDEVVLQRKKRVRKTKVKPKMQNDGHGEI